MKLLVLFIALFSLFFACAASAQESGLKYYGIEADIKDDFSVHNRLTFILSEPETSFSYEVGRRVYNFRFNSSFDVARCSVKVEGAKSVITCALTGLPTTPKLAFEFDTRDEIKKALNNIMFDMSFMVADETERVSVFLKLPFNSVLSSGSEANESFYPRDGQIITDGRHIMVYWDRENLEAGKLLRFSAMYENTGNSGEAQNIVIMVLMVVIAVAMLSMLLIARRRAAPKSINVIAPMLTDDERKVIDIIAKNGGSVIQRVIVRETDFSKAKVSRIVNGLKGRKVLDIEPVGRTNKIILKIKEGKDAENATKAEAPGPAGE